SSTRYRSIVEKQYKAATTADLCGYMLVSLPLEGSSKTYEKIIPSSSGCRQPYRLRTTACANSGSRRDGRLSVRPLRENDRRLGLCKPGLQELDHCTAAATPLGSVWHSAVGPDTQ